MNYFEHKVQVKPEHIDVYNHVNNVVYVQWIQDIADAHWNLLTEGKGALDYAWFVVKHEINYKQQAVVHDDLLVKTWIGETGGVKSVRHVEIYRDSVLLVSSQTTFCLIDLATKKPRRVTADVLALLVPSKNS
ncbi:Thioesterase [Tenacibaculum litopenaei]|jgi:acyl-CoA thioester hydrolase|uniref:acyl-CoA thioesterase n=1 Tax=Tenacibaculum litopenaei TaxID=396016 RepID=UPI0038938B71